MSIIQRIEKLFSTVEKIDLENVRLLVTSLDNSGSFVIEYSNKLWKIKPNVVEITVFRLFKNSSDLLAYILSRHLNIEKLDRHISDYLADLAISMSYKARIIEDNLGKDVIRKRECRQDIFRDCNIDVFSTAEKEVRKKKFQLLNGNKKC